MAPLNTMLPQSVVLHSFISLKGAFIAQFASIAIWHWTPKHCLVRIMGLLVVSAKSTHLFERMIATASIGALKGELVGLPVTMNRANK